MAFTASTLMRTINESSMYGCADNTIAHEFIGESMSAVTSEIQFGIMSEAADYMDLVAASEDILAEAAISNPDSYYILQESVFESIKNGLLKFWKKIKEFVKGLIEKLKAAFYRLIGKTDKWVSIMRPKITDAARRSGSSEFKYEMFDYDEKFITSDMSGKLEAIMNEWDGEVGNIFQGINPMANKLAAFIQKNARMSPGVQARLDAMTATNTNRDRRLADLKKEKESYEAEVGKYGREKADDAVSPDSPEIKSTVDDLEKQTEDLERKMEDWNDDFPGRLGAHYGVGKATSMESLWSDVKEKAQGGSTEKTQQTIGNKVNSMLSAVENSKKAIENIKKAYEGHLRTLSKYESDLNKLGSLNIKDESKMHIPNNISTAYNEYWKAHANTIMKKTQAYESALNSARQINISLIEEMTGSYMSALTAFAGYKEPKKEK